MPRQKSHYLLFLSIAFAIFWLAWAVGPKYRVVWWTENALLALGVGALALTYKRLGFPT